jgi:cytochrome c5
MRWLWGTLLIVGCSEPALEPELESKYQASCAACHEAGAADAPRRADADDWAPRLARGEEALLQAVRTGMAAMPPNGLCQSCTESDLRALVRYLAGVQ